ARPPRRRPPRRCATGTAGRPCGPGRCPCGPATRATAATSTATATAGPASRTSGERRRPVPAAGWAPRRAGCYGAAPTAAPRPVAPRSPSRGRAPSSQGRSVRTHRIGWLAAVAVVLAALAACSSDDGDSDAAEEDGARTEGAATEVALPESWEGYTSESYADDAHWLCKPGIADDVCEDTDLDATVVEADGSTEVVEHEVAEDPPVDCFYVYPTTSYDEGPNSDWEPGEAEEISTVRNQAARLTASCRVFAPIYRQATLSAIGGGFREDTREVAYGDVLDAFMEYVVNLSDGRGFVLIGHSQGAGMLSRLIAEEIDDEPLLRDRLVAAYILGSSVQVPECEVVGGDFENVPLCEEEDQTG